MADPFQTELLVTHKDEEYVFAVPSIFDEIKLGVRVKDILRSAGNTGATSDIDNGTMFTARAMAAFDIGLKRGPKWVFTAADADQKPKVDSSLFLPDHVDDVLEVYVKYTDLLQSFRQGGNPAKPPAAE